MLLMGWFLWMSSLIHAFVLAKRFGKHRQYFCLFTKVYIFWLFKTILYGILVIVQLNYVQKNVFFKLYTWDFLSLLSAVCIHGTIAKHYLWGQITAHCYLHFCYFFCLSFFTITILLILVSDVNTLSTNDAGF